ncbi:MAG TPA: TetR/AcrR family transcriptional regulator [Pyrinomonadaceae bacterium]|jgi:AcrR family transcriptional regulator|nr:TetR/AcrR family transcriptional regulator [Pyrinomonadaceae bacterium]
MSDNTRLAKTHIPHLKKKKIDARVRKTRDALGDALVSLMQEKPFDSITVQDVLDRAQVGRSTFYSHFSDKDDLLMSDADEFFEALAMALSAHGDKSDRVFPVKEFFTHVAEARQFVEALRTSGRMYDNFELAQGHFARGIERRLSEIPRGAKIPAQDRPALACAHAGALLSLLRWWIDRGMKEPADEMDKLFHRIVWSGGES